MLYVKCECLNDARSVFDEMHDRNVVSWTALMSGYARRGYACEALDLFVQMLRSGNCFIVYVELNQTCVWKCACVIFLVFVPV